MEKKNKKKQTNKPFTLVGDPESKEVRSCLGYGRRSRGIVGDSKKVREQPMCAKTWVGSRRATTYQINSNLWVVVRSISLVVCL